MSGVTLEGEEVSKRKGGAHDLGYMCGTIQLVASLSPMGKGCQGLEMKGIRELGRGFFPPSGGAPFV